jgi:hypothetical protein
VRPARALRNSRLSSHPAMADVTATRFDPLSGARAVSVCG